MSKEPKRKNNDLMGEINNSGFFCLSHTKLNEKVTISLVVSLIRTAKESMEDA